MNATRDTTPFLISAVAPALSWNAGGVVQGTVNLPGGALVNPYNVPVEINDLIFLLTSSATASISNSALEINLRAGRHGLTNGFAPIVGVGPVYSAFLEDPVPQAGTRLGFVPIRWVFPRPMILKAGAAITGAVRLSPKTVFNVPAGSTTVTVVARGRKLPPGTPSPIRGFLPFMSGEIFTSASRQVANNLSFMNTLAVPLEVTSINARVVSANFDGLSVGLGGFTVTGPGGPLGTPRRSVIAPGTPADGVFGQRDSIEVTHTLQRGEYYMITMSTLPAYPQIAVAISGYREEVL